jgi:ribosomal protein S18 acetylase RimI-like enzyme
MKFREANLGDLSQLLAIEQKIIEAERPFNSSIKSENTTYYDIEGLVLGSDSYLTVAEDTDMIIATGYAQIRRSKASLNHDNHSYLGFMYVSPDFRGREINKDLVEQLIFWSKSKGVQAIYLEVYSENNSAIKAYEKVGFEPCLLEMKLI